MRLTLWAGLLALGYGVARRGRGRGVRRVLRISRVVGDLDRAEAFYRDGLGFRQVSEGRLDARLVAMLLPAGGATVRQMRLGEQEIELVRWDQVGPPYPAGSRSDDCWFQHLAIVVNDMAAAYARLLRAGPVPISTAGPQQLPAPPKHVGVTAYKFRDPDGHPLELIHFPPGEGRAVWQQRAGGPCIGIDHSALSIADTGRSLRFYRGLGFRRADRTFNHGPAQAAMDGLAGATAVVSGLRPTSTEGPGLELLGYLPPGRAAPPRAADSAVTDWVTLDMGGGRAALVRDPDGHLFVLN